MPSVPSRSICSSCATCPCCCARTTARTSAAASTPWVCRCRIHPAIGITCLPSAVRAAAQLSSFAIAARYTGDTNGRNSHRSSADAPRRSMPARRIRCSARVAVLSCPSLPAIHVMLSPSMVWPARCVACQVEVGDGRTFEDDLKHTGFYWSGEAHSHRELTRADEHPPSLRARVRFACFQDLGTRVFVCVVCVRSPAGTVSGCTTTTAGDRRARAPSR